jgi:hypothetical protein
MCLCMDSYCKETTANNGRFNWYSKILHDNALQNLAYGYPHDDYYDQSSTVSLDWADSTSLKVIIPSLK